MRNVLAQVPKGNADMVAAAIRTIFAQPDPEHVRDQREVIAVMLGRQAPKIEGMVRVAKENLRAFTGVPRTYLHRIWSTNLLERVNKEIKRRTDVVGKLLNPEALLRRAGAVLIEQHDELAAADRRQFSEASMAILTSDVNSLMTDIPLSSPPSPRHGHPIDLRGRTKSHHSVGRHPGRAAVVGLIVHF